MVGTIVFLLVGVALWVAGGVLLYLRSRTQRKAGVMSRIETSGAGEVAALAPGTLVEVKGDLRCDAPLVSEMAGQSCAYYSSRVIREYLRQDRDDDDAGSDRRSETISQTERFAPFFVEDATGRVAVNAEGAEVDAKQVMDRFERDTGGGPSISLAGVTLNLGRGERTIGYRYVESVLPVDVPVYVLGAVQAGGVVGDVPEGEDARFIVSHRSEEALGQSLGKEAFWLGIVAAGLFLFGAIFAAVGLASALGYIQFQ